MEAFNASMYSSQLNLVQRKLAEADDLKNSIIEADAEAQKILAEKRARKGRLLEHKKTLDLRSALKNDRTARTTYLREVGILLPNEEIRKVREARVR